MPLTFAGVSLIPKTKEASLVMERWINSDAWEKFSYQAFQNNQLNNVPEPDRPSPQKPRFNTLFWPNGASRWAEFNCLIAGQDVDTLKGIITPESPTPNTLSFIDDETGNTVSVSMYVLTFQQVFVQDGTYDLWWLTLVDNRFYGYLQKETYTFNVGDSWATLLTNLCGAAYAISPTVAAIPAAYGKPTGLRWSFANNPLPLIIDAVASTVGLRAVFNFNGTLNFVTSTEAITNDDTQFTTLSTLGLVGIGGRVTVDNICGVIPANVAVAFWGDVALISVANLATLAIPAYGSLTGVTNTYGWIMGDLDASGSSSARSNYATQAATDYYNWALSLTDVTFNGVQVWNPTGLEDSVEWEWMPGQKPIDEVTATSESTVLNVRMPRDRVVTRVNRSNFSDRNLYGDRPPPGYTYNIKLTGKGSSPGGFQAWAGNIQIVNSSGNVVDGPPINWGASNNYVAVPIPNGVTPHVGDYVTAIPDPFTAGVWTFTEPTVSSGGSGGSGSCGSCAWLLDATLNTCITFSFIKAVGSCSCADSGTANGVGSTFIMQYSPAFPGTTWVATGMFTTCCGCAFSMFQFDPGTLNATFSIQDSQACGSGICGSGSGGGGTWSAFNLTLTYLGCCADGSVQFAGYGQNSCCGPPGTCGNYYVVSVSCSGGCAAPYCDCAACCGYFIPDGLVADFSSTSAFIGIPVAINYAGNCMFKTDCKPLNGLEILAEVTIVHQTPPTDSYWQLTIAGATYKLLVGLQTGCSVGTYALVSGPAAAPSTVNVLNVTPYGLPATICASRELSIVITAGDSCAVGNGAGPVTDAMTPDMWCWTVDTPCTGGTGCNIGFCLTCNQDGTFTLQVGANSYSPIVQVAVNGVFFFIFNSIVNECGSNITVTISN